MGLLSLRLFCDFNSALEQINLTGKQCITLVIATSFRQGMNSVQY